MLIVIHTFIFLSNNTITPKTIALAIAKSILITVLVLRLTAEAASSQSVFGLRASTSNPTMAIGAHATKDVSIRAII